MLSQSQATEIINFNHVYFKYENTFILENVNFKIYNKEFVALVGPNGGGKTTLLKLITKILKPTKGTINFIVTDNQIQIGYVPQYLYHDMAFPISVLEVVLLGLIGKYTIKLYFNKREKNKAYETLKLLGISNLANKPFSSLSGGQKQRVLIARALISNPNILILDEPTSNVDYDTEIKLLDILKELNKHVTIILATHDIAFISSIVTKVICVNKIVNIHPLEKIDEHFIKNLYKTDVCAINHNIKLTE